MIVHFASLFHVHNPAKPSTIERYKLIALAGDFQFFVRRDDQDFHGRVVCVDLTNADLAAFVLLFIQPDAQIFQVLCG
jgi:hypothetical protein